MIDPPMPPIPGTPRSAPTETHRNIEVKARVAAPDRLRETVAELAHHRLPDQEQRDTYFFCERGRLKLREIHGAGISGGFAAQLIWYERANRQAARQSDYQLVPIANADGLKLALQRAWGIRGVVEKHREIYLVHNVRIHLDHVASLGNFMELEAVIGPDADERLSHARLEGLLERLSIDPTQHEPLSYADLRFAVTAEE